MDAFKVVVFLVGLLGRTTVCSLIKDDKIKVSAEVSVPENIKEGKIRVEYEFKTLCDQDPENKPVYNDCGEVPALSGSGIYRLRLGGRNVSVYCELNSDVSKYLVIQRRRDGSQEFYRNWTDYEIGFGSLMQEFWIGNKVLNSLTTGKNYKLRIDLESFNGTKVFAEYQTFIVGPPETFYKLTVNRYSGTAGDSFTYHNGQKFSTYDKDNDEYNTSCAVEFKGAWWYKSCHQSNLNGIYFQGRHTSFADGINWLTFLGYYESMRTVTMKIFY